VPGQLLDGEGAGPLQTRISRNNLRRRRVGVKRLVAAAATDRGLKDAAARRRNIAITRT